MRTVITALQIVAETCVFNDDGKLASRTVTRPEIVVLEAEIPEEVVAWVSALIAKRGA